MDEDIVVEESLIKSVESRFLAVKEDAAKRWLKLTYEKQKNKAITSVNSAKQQMSSQTTKFSSHDHVEQVLKDHMVFIGFIVICFKSISFVALLVAKTYMI